jgi:transposase
MAAVVNVEGFLKYSEIFEGNLTDSKSLLQIIEQLSSKNVIASEPLSEQRQIIVMDAGIATEDNLSAIKQKGFDYMCVSRSGMSKYEIDNNAKEVEVKDNKGQSIKLQKVTMPNRSDTFIQVKSVNKGLKESGMNSRFSQKFEEGLTEIAASLSKPNGTKKLTKVWERIGRLKQKYSSIAKYYNIETRDDGNNIVTSIEYTIIDKDKQEGIYLLRTTLDTREENVLWTIYNSIREIESTFRILKTDLDLRPIYHKSDDAAKAHLHLGILAYWLVNTARYQLKQKGINHNWKELVRIMDTQKAVTTTMVNEYNQVIVIRQCSEPTQDNLTIYDALGFKPKPFTRKKFVVPPDKFQKNETQ